MYTLVARSTDYPKNHIESLDRVENDELVNKIARAYMMTLNHEREKINNTFKAIYHRFLNVSESKTSEVYLTIKEIERRNNLSILRMNKEIQEYFGKPINWFKKDKNQNYSAIHLEKIEQAFRLVRKNASKERILECIYN